MKIQRSVTFPFFFFFNDTATTEIYTLSLHDALPIFVEASVDDLVLEAGVVRVRGVPDRTVSLAEVARVAPGLEAEARFDPPGPTFSGAVHLAVVEVDPETGRVAVRKYVVVEDCGPVLNPLLVEGQIHGAVAQGLGEALLEWLASHGEGQLLTATPMGNALPGATSLPSPPLDPPRAPY